MISSADIRMLADAIIKAIPPKDEIWTIATAAAALGRPEAEVIKMCKRGVIPAHKLKGGKIWYISKNELEKTLFGGNI